jgi:SAM-dependent methyltransferase
MFKVSKPVNGAEVAPFSSIPAEHTLPSERRILLNPQAFKNGEIHDWYRTIWGYSDHLVSSLLDEFRINQGQRVLDPFCGSGTTLVECKKRGVAATGVDANPSSCFATTVKTSWELNAVELRDGVAGVTAAYPLCLNDRARIRSDISYAYITKSGMKDRGWICERPLLKSIAIKHAILELDGGSTLLKAFLLLALIAEVVRNSSNVKFGPELYCGKPKGDVDVLAGFRDRCMAMAEDLEKTQDIVKSKTRVFHGDARVLSASRDLRAGGLYDAVICSPPYPTEHDYTRNSRLELAFLEQVHDLESLRAIKRKMLRSHTKGIYVSDTDSKSISRFPSVRRLVEKIQERTPEDTHGFAKLYPEVVKQYFGGMRLHFGATLPLLRKGAMAAYIVGDQASYQRIHIPTAEILGAIARSQGFEVVEIRQWRDRLSSGARKKMIENILVLKKK